MQRKKLKKTNEINRSNAKSRILMCVMISLALVGVGVITILPREAAAVPLVVYGYIYECDGITSVGGAQVMVTDINTGFSYTYTSESDDGFYSVTFSDQPAEFAVGDTLEFMVSTPKGWTNWPGATHVIASTAPIQKDISLCWYFKPPTATSPSGMPDFAPQGNSDTAAAVANCLWWYDGAYPDLVTGTPMDLMVLLDTYWTDSDNVTDVEAGIDQYFLDTVGTNVLVETTIFNPEFDIGLGSIAVELERCQDVILQIARIEQGEPVETLWVTAAGVNHTGDILAISDPFLNNAEAGGWGLIPVPHPVHPANDPTHNDPSLVSHDFYHVIPGVTYNWALENYGGPGIHYEILNAVVVCPYITEDMEVFKTIFTGVDGDYHICLYDSYGDGWNGGTVDVYVNGVLIHDGLTLASGAGPVCYAIPVVSGDVITTDYTSGSYAYENYYEILDCNGAYVDGAWGDDLVTDLTVNVPMGAYCEYVEIDFGETVTFNISVHNTGNVDVEDLDIYDQLPSGLEYVPGSATVTPTSESPQNLAWDYGYTLAPDAWLYIEFDATAVYCCQNETNTATAIGFGEETYVEIIRNDTATVHAFAIPSLTVTKYVWNPETSTWEDSNLVEIKKDTPAWFRIDIYNDPTTNPCCDLTNVYVQDIFGPYLNFTDASAPPVYVDDTQVVWQFTEPTPYLRDVIFSDGFEACTPESYMPGWKVVATDTATMGNWLVYSSSTYAHSGTRSMRADPGTSVPGAQDAWLISPQFSLSATPGDLTFWHRAYSASYWVNYDVLVSTSSDPYDYGSYTTLLSINATSTTYAQATIGMGSYANQDVYIAWQMYSAEYNYGYAHIDDVALDGYTMDFDTLIPYDMDGWASFVVSGTDIDNVWQPADASTSTHPNTYDPYEGEIMAWYESYWISTGNTARLQPGVINLAGYSGCELTFYMHHSSSYSTANDYVDVQVSPDNSTWTTLATYYQYDATNPGWVQHTVDLSAYDGDSVYIGFLGVSGYSGDLSIDLVEITGIPMGAGSGELSIPPGDTYSLYFNATAIGEHCTTIQNYAQAEATCACGDDTVWDEDTAVLHIFYDNNPPITDKEIIGPCCPPFRGTTQESVTSRFFTLSDKKVEKEIPLQDEQPSQADITTPIITPWSRDCETLYYGEWIAALFWRIPDNYGYGFDTPNVLFTVPYDYFNNPVNLTSATLYFYAAGCTDVTGEGVDIIVWADDGMGYPGTELGRVNVPYADMAFYPNPLVVNLSSLGITFTGNEDFHIGYTTVNQSAGNQMSILSDAGSGDPPFEYRSGLYSGYFGAQYWFMYDLYGTDYDFLIAAEICGEKPIIQEGPYWITSDSQLCFTATDDIAGAAELYIEVWWDSDNDGVADQLNNNLIILDNGPRDLDPTVGVINYCMSLPEECYHEVRYYSIDYYENIEMPHVEIDLVDNTPPMVNKTFDGPGLMDYLFLNEDTIITLEAVDLPESFDLRAYLERDSYVLFNEDFEDGIPGAMTYNDYNDGDSDDGDFYWMTYGDYYSECKPQSGQHYVLGAAWGYPADAPNAAYDDGLETPEVDCSTSTAVYVTYSNRNFLATGYTHIRVYQSGTLLGSVPGGTTQELQIANITSLAAGKNHISVEMYYDDVYNGGDWWFDNVTILGVGTPPGPSASGCASGVTLIEYRIWYNGWWTNWTTYWDENGEGTGPFSLEGGCTHYIQYRAWDCVGNHHTAEIFNLTFRDTDELLNEGFESTTFPPTGWDQTIYNSAATWAQNTLGGEPEGSYCACVWWDYYGQDEWLFTTDPIDLSGYDTATLKFWTYNYDSVSWVEHDYIKVSTNGGTTWDTLGDMAADYPNTFWGEIVYDLGAYIGDEIIIGFHRVTPDGGSGAWGVDHVRVEASVDDGGNGGNGGNGNETGPYPPPEEDSNYTRYQQVHHVDLEPPMSWIELELDYNDHMITPYTEFMIKQEDHACNQPGGSQCCFIRFRVDGPPGSKFYWNGQYLPADGTWLKGNSGLDTPIAFQIRDEMGYIKTGKYTVEFYAEDCLGNTEETIHRETYYPDTTAPSTTLLFNGPHYNDQDEWINTDTGIAIRPNNEQDTKLIKYRIDNDQWRTYEQPFQIQTEGTHIISYYSVDWTNNAEPEKTTTVIVDGTAPEAYLILEGDTYDDDTTTWITSDTHLQVSTSDTGCGIKTTYYRLDGSDWTEYTGSFTLTNGNLIEFYTEDHLGNTAPIQHLQIGVDNEAPSITYLAPQGNHLYIAGREILSLRTESVIIGSLRVEASATDTSGIEHIELYIDGILRYSEYGGTLQWLWDEKSLFTHTLTINAYDHLGRVAIKETTVKIFNL